MNHIGILSNPTQQGITQPVEHLANRFAARGASVLLSDDLKSLCDCLLNSFAVRPNWCNVPMCWWPWAVMAPFCGSGIGARS